MTRITLAVFLTAALAISACSKTGRLDGANDVDLNAANGGAGAYGAGGLNGSASDPSSTAYFQQTVGDRVLFAVDQHTLSDSARVTLDGQARWLMTNSYNAVIEGHADEQGTREYNLALGARRASAAMDYLISRGVPASRLKIVSYGKERPIEICSVESCYAKNRRAVTVIAAGGLTS